MFFTVLTVKAQVTESTLDNFYCGDLNYFEIVNLFDSVISLQIQASFAQGLSNGGATVSSNLVSDELLKKYSRWQFFWKTRIDQEGTAKSLNRELLNWYFDNLEICKSEKTDFVNWQALGPSNSTGSNDLQHNQGRVESIAVNPFDSRDIILGTKNGGYYLQQDDDAAWHNTTNDENISVFGSRDVEYHPSIENFVFAATGNENNYGIGLIKSTDGGESWQNTSLSYDASMFENDENRTAIYDVTFDPRSNINRTVAYAYEFSGAAGRIYRLAGSIDNSWDEITQIPLYVPGSNREQAKNVQLEINKGNPNELWFWTMQGIQRCVIPFNDPSSNTTLSGPFPYNNLPSSAVVPSNFAQIGNISSSNNGEIFSLSHFSGHTYLCIFNFSTLSWDFVAEHDIRLGKRQNFCVNPLDSRFMYADYKEGVRKSTNGGLTFLDMNDDVLHDDVRCLKITAPSADGMSDVVYIGTDGGIARTSSTSPDTWVSINWNGLDITQFYGLDVAEFDNDYVLAGAQDNSINFLRNSIWTETEPDFADNFNSLIDPRNNGMVYQQANYRFHSGIVSTTTNLISTNPSSTPAEEFQIRDNHYGYSALIDFEFDLEERNPDRIVSGWFNIYESTSQGSINSWTKINSLTLQNESDDVTALKISQSNPSIIYYSRSGENWPHDGSVDLQGGVFRLEKIGQQYVETNISNNLRDLNNISSSPNMFAEIKDLTIDPFNHDRIWVVFGNYKADAKVWFTENGGVTWSNADVSGSIPNFPINAIEYQSGTNDRIYIGTDIGVFYKDNTMSCWEQYGEQVGFKVMDISIKHCSQEIFVATWGSGIWKAPLLVDNRIKYYQVNQDETWTEDKVMKSSILVKSGATLDLVGMNLYMPKNSKIIVEKGARVNVNTSTITNQCDENWHGFEVRGNAGKAHPDKALILANQYPVEEATITLGQTNIPLQNPNADHGVLYINSSSIEHAKNAISLSSKDPISGDFVLEGSGGIVIAQNTIFLNCRRSAEFIKYNFHNVSSFENCQFITDDEYRLPEVEPHHISMWATKDVLILGCTFENSNGAVSIDEEVAGTGIYTIDASYIAKAKCANVDVNGDCLGFYNNPLEIDPNRFINLHRGFYSTATGELPGSLQINKNDFYNVKWGVILRSTNNALAVRNKFNSPHTAATSDGNGQPGYAIYLEGMHNFTCTENEVNNLWSGILTSSCGVGFNELYKNKINRTFYYGTTGFGLDIIGLQTGKNLKFKCNEFSNTGYIGDIAVTGMITDQGDYFKAATNTFSSTNAYNGVFNGWIATNNSNGFVTPTFNYYHPINTNMIPEYANGVNLIQINSQVSVNYNLDCPTLPLGHILQKNAQEIDVEESQAVLDGLNTGSNSDSYIKDRATTELINAYLIKEDYLAIENILQAQSANPWRRIQQAEFQRIQGKYSEAKVNLLSITNDGDKLEAQKDLANLYLIRVLLEEKGKTWFDVSESDLNFIKTLAMSEEEAPATMSARNVLELIRGIHFEERIDKFDFTTSNPIDTPVVVKPRFRLYPNPIAGQLNLDYNGAIPVPFTVVIYELIKNQQVYKGEMNGNPFSLDVSNWLSGFYSILVFDNEGKELFKSKTHIKN